MNILFIIVFFILINDSITVYYATHQFRIKNIFGFFLYPFSINNTSIINFAKDGKNHIDKINDNIIDDKSYRNYLESIFMFNVAHKLKDGKSLLDIPILPISKQKSCLKHFIGYFGESYENLTQNTLKEIIEDFESNRISLSTCVSSIKNVFISTICSRFTPLDHITDEVSLNRQLYLIYSADLMASYILLFTGKNTRRHLYRFIWYDYSFIDGTVDWLCCNWVLNNNIHDHTLHNNNISLDDISTDELIDIIRLHKHHLSPDFVKQRSRKVLNSVNRIALLSIFQSIMLKILWGNRITDEYIKHEGISDKYEHNIEGANLDDRPDVDALFIKNDYSDNTDENNNLNAMKLNTLTSWIEEYRRRRPYKKRSLFPASKKLDFKESDFIIKMKYSLKRVTEQLELFNKMTIGLPNSMPVNLAFNSKGSRLNVSVDDNITIYKVKECLKTLIKFYHSNLENHSELYGNIHTDEGIDLMKFLLSYNKSDLVNILCSTMMAIPEIRPIVTKQDYATYSLLPFNTIAKLVFIAIMRINPKYSLDFHDSIDNIGGKKSLLQSSNDISSMVFEMRELTTVLNYNNQLLTSDLIINGNLVNCVVLTSQQNRDILEKILLHLSNYDLIYNKLKDHDLENVDKNLNNTIEVIRKVKLSIILKRMTYDELTKFYHEILNEINLNNSLKLPEEFVEVDYSCLSDDLNINPGEDVYSKIVGLLDNHELNNESDINIGHSDKSNDSDVVDERQNILNLIGDVDITPYIDSTFTTKNIDEMNISQLKTIADKIINEMKSDPNCDYIVVDSDVKYPFKAYIFKNYYKPDYRMISSIRYTNSSNLGCRSTKIVNVFIKNLGTSGQRLYSTPESYSHALSYNVTCDFPTRSQNNLESTWQDPHLMIKSKRLFNRVDTDGIEYHINNWVNLGLNDTVSSAAVAWIKKSILDVVQADPKDLEIVPTEIQKKAIPEILKGNSRNILIASNAASGKTLSYLLPIINKLKEEEIHKLRPIQTPRSLIIVPNRELAHQILSVMKGLSHVAKFKSESITGGFFLKKQRKQIIDSLVDIVVCTPDRLKLMSKYINLSKLKYVILDEAETLLNEGFWSQIHPILDRFHHNVCTILVASNTTFISYFYNCQNTMYNRSKYNISTIGSGNNKRDELNKRMEEYFGNIDYNKSKTGFKLCEDILNSKVIVDRLWLHRPCRGTTHEFIELKGRDKVLELINVIKYQRIRKCKKILIFCNTIQSCRAIEYYLLESGLPATSLHGKVPILQRRKNYLDFINNTSGIMVCSDIVSRGLDLYADAVVMFDFPFNSMDYLRRSGRVGRIINNDHIAPKGYSISLLKNRDIPLATAIQRSINMPLFPLHKLSPRKSDYNHLTGRLIYLTQSGGYYKLANLLREYDIKGEFDYYDMNKYLELFKNIVKDQKRNSLKKIMLRRRRICKRRRILSRRLKLMKRWNKAIRLKQRIISKLDKIRNKYVRLKNDSRKCARIKDLRPIRGKLMELKTSLKYKLNEKKVKRNTNKILKFIKDIQKIAKDAPISPNNGNNDTKYKLLNEIRTMIGKKVKRICSLI